MSTEALGAVSAAISSMVEPSLAPLQGAAHAAAAGASGASGPGFSNMVTQGLEQVNGQLLASQADLQQLSVGNVQNLHQVMIRLEESRLAFQLTMQVRNRLLESYQDVMRMQV
jgi:flagellar hook-basal body complex protein FliE